jgi:hypothetical protein
MLQIAAIMADVFSDANTKIRYPTSSLSNFKNCSAKIQDIYVLSLDVLSSKHSNETAK